MTYDQENDRLFVIGSSDFTTSQNNNKTKKVKMGDKNGKETKNKLQIGQKTLFFTRVKV